MHMMLLTYIHSFVVLQEVLGKLEDLHGFDFSSMDSNNDGYVDSVAFVHSGMAAELPGLDCKCCCCCLDVDHVPFVSLSLTNAESIRIP